MLRSLYLEPIGDVGYLAGAALELVIGVKRFLEIPYSRARCSLVVTPLMMNTAALIADDLKRVAPAAIPMLLGSMPGVSLGFDLEGRNLELRTAEVFSVRVTTPTTATGEGAVRIYLNGEMGRLTQ